MQPRILAFLPVLVCSALCSASEITTEGRWLTTAAGCLVWDALPQSDETVTWSGVCADGKTSGHGIEVYRYTVDGTWKEERYVGEMEGGRPHGPGTLYYDNGDRFDGTFANGHRTGHGAYTHANGDRYEGDFVDDRMTGQGSFAYHSGGRYDGEFENGIYQGEGTFAFANGNRYVGHFEGGLPNGPGVFRTAGGETFSGTWSDGCYRQGNRVAAVGTSPAKCGFE